MFEEKERSPDVNFKGIGNQVVVLLGSSEGTETHGNVLALDREGMNDKRGTSELVLAGAKGLCLTRQHWSGFTNFTNNMENESASIGQCL